MQIHELGTRTPGVYDYAALDTGSQTYKAQVGDLKPEYTSYDAANPSSWVDVTTMGSNTKISTFFERLTYIVRNVRYLWKLIGSNAFSNVAETISGAIGNTALGTTATTLSGAIAEHEEDISTINGNLSPTSISRPTIYQSRVSIAAGGYIKVGRMVVVDIQVTAALSSYSGGSIFTGFPASSGTNSISAYVLDGSNQIPMCAHISSSGNMTITSPSSVTMTGKDIFIAGAYIAN